MPLDEIKPGNKITPELRKLLLPQPGAKHRRRRPPRQGSSNCPGREVTHGRSLHGSAGRSAGIDSGDRRRFAGSRRRVLDGLSGAAGPEPIAAPQAANPLLSDKLLDAKVRLHRRLIEEVNLQALDKMPEDEIRTHIQQLVTQYILVERLALNQQELNEFVSEILDEMTGLGPLEPLLKDSTVNDILINGHECVYVERARHARALRRCASRTKRTCCASSTRSCPRSAAGSTNRIRCATRACWTARASTSRSVRSAVDGPLVSIRKFSKKPFNLNKLVEVGAIRPQMAELLAAAVKARVTLIISGGTGSGKTTMLNALSAFISEKERLLTIEDAAELQLQQPHVGRMETRPPNIEGKGEIRQRELVKNALRMRPDRIILGECRGEEAFDMLQAMNTGHEGSMATIHANTPRDAISRLEQMIGMAGLPMTVASIRGQIAAAIRVIVQLSRLSDGKRRVTVDRRDHRARRRHHPDAGNLQVRAHRHCARRQRARPFPGDRRAPALPRRAGRHGHQNPRHLF